MEWAWSVVANRDVVCLLQSQELKMPWSVLGDVYGVF